MCRKCCVSRGCDERVRLGTHVFIVYMCVWLMLVVSMVDDGRGCCTAVIFRLFALAGLFKWRWLSGVVLFKISNCVSRV